ARNWPCCGNARRPTKSRCSRSWKTGAIARRKAISPRCVTSRAHCAATPERSPRYKSKARRQAGFFCPDTAGLLDFGFLVNDVLAGNRVEFLHFYLVGGRALVLRGGVEMTGAGRRFQFDFLSHLALRLTCL